MSETRRQRRREFKCQMCGNPFKAARDHAECCSPKCRKALSRLRVAHKVGAAADAAREPDGAVTCGDCGVERGEGFAFCPVCKSTKVK